MLFKYKKEKEDFNYAVAAASVNFTRAVAGPVWTVLDKHN
jgi:hypothetical protein